MEPTWDDMRKILTSSKTIAIGAKVVWMQPGACMRVAHQTLRL